ncbi:MAG: metallophosphoesterase family protein [Acutalibacteraceae bacterium]
MDKNIAPLAIHVISDIHFYAKSVGTVGPEFEKANGKSTFDLLHNEEILDALANQLIKDEECQIVLVSGDLTNNGEPDSHVGALKMLGKIKDSGKKVYMITATHDYRDGDETDAYTETGKIRIKTHPRDTLFDMYQDFGPNEAISVHRQSMSYSALLADGYRLLALNDDMDGDGHSGFSDELFAWIEQQIKEAHENGQFVVAMTHHPMISPSPFYSIIGKNDMMGGHEKRRNQLADLGVNFILTGHTHIQDISYIYSEKGNIFYDITTASPVGYPGTYRKLLLDPAKGKIDVKAVKITETPDFDMSGTLEEHLANKFFGMIKDIVLAAGHDTEKLARMVTAFSVKPKLIYKIGWLIKPFAKLLASLKISVAAKIGKKESGLKKSDYEAIKDEKVIDFIISLVMNLYGGDSPYYPDTAYYKITMGVCSVLDSVLDALGIKLHKLIKNAESVSALVESLLYNSGIPDGDAVLTLFDENGNAPKIETIKNETVIKKSKKGKGIIAGAVFGVVLFLPLILLWLIFGFLINLIKYHKQLGET